MGRAFISLVIFLTIISVVVPYPGILAAGDNPIRLGAALQLSGPLATYGNLIRGGIELASDDLKRDGIEVELTFEDVPMTGLKAVSGFRKLIEIDRVDAIAGNFSNVALASAAPLIEKSKILTFHTAAADPLLLDSGDYIVTTNVRIKDEASAMAEYLIRNQKFSRVAVISIQTNFGQAYRNFFIERFKALGGEITADETFEIADTEYKSQLLKIRSANPEAIYGACFGPFLGRAMKHGRELGIKAPWFSVYESEDSSVLEAAAGASEGLRYFVTSSEGSNPRYKEFRARYFERFQMEPGTFGSNSYDAAMILGKTLHRCKRDPDCAFREIYALKDYPGVSGTFSLEPDGATRKNFVLREIRSGAFKDFD